MNNKKSESGLVIIIVLLVVIFFFGWLININQRECKSNKDCSTDSYCGSDFSCHQFPTIQKTVVQYNFLAPSIIIGIAIVVAAILLRWKNAPSENKQALKNQIEQQVPEEIPEDIEPYYKSENKVKIL